MQWITHALCHRTSPILSTEFYQADRLRLAAWVLLRMRDTWVGGVPTAGGSANALGKE